MSKGKKEDRKKTAQKLKDRNPPKKGKTWLRHRVDCQSGIIDLMLLEGSFSIEEMAQKLAVFYPKRPRRQLLKRVRDHIDHLQEGDRRDNSSLHKEDQHRPHCLKLKEVNGKWMFNLEHLI